jgi:hypothetical protein
MNRVFSQSDWSNATAVTSLVPRNHLNYLYWRLSQNPNLNFEFVICSISRKREPPVQRQNQYSDLIRPGWRRLTSLIRPQAGKFLDIIPDKQPSNPVFVDLHHHLRPFSSRLSGASEIQTLQRGVQVEMLRWSFCLDWWQTMGRHQTYERSTYWYMRSVDCVKGEDRWCERWLQVTEPSLWAVRCWLVCPPVNRW